MKKTLFLVFIVVSSFSFAQRLPGWVITNDGEKIEGYLKRFSKIKSQRKVKFYKTRGTKPVVYGPKDLQAYKIADQYYESLPYEGFSGKKKVFLLRSLKGKISLFSYFLKVENDRGREVSFSGKKNTKMIIDFDGNKIEEEVLAVKDANEYLKLASGRLALKFKTVMSEFVSDHPTLAEKIKNKEEGYQYLSMYKIIDEYNAHFAK